MVTIKDGCGCDPCDCDWKQKLKEAYSRAIQSVNKIGDETGRVYYPDGTGFVKVPLPTKEQIDSLAQIDAIKASVDELNVTVPALETQVAGVTGSLVSNVEVLNGTTAGKFKVRIDREKASLIDSNDYDLSKVNSIELIQGSGPAMVKAQLTLSDGTVLRSDDFLFTSESIGTDVYISSFTFKAGNVDGTISADIGLNNGTTLEANNFVVPTDPSVVSTITDLQTRLSAVESGSGVNGLDALKATVETHTTEITQLTNDVGNLMTSKVNVAQGTENAGKALVIGADGNVTPGVVSGGEVWEEVDLNNFPTDWKAGDRVKFTFNRYGTVDTPSSWTTTPNATNMQPMYGSEVFETLIPIGDQQTRIILNINANYYAISFCYMYSIKGYNNWNSGNIFSITYGGFNGGGTKNTSIDIPRSNVTDYIGKMWRLKK